MTGPDYAAMSERDLDNHVRTIVRDLCLLGGRLKAYHTHDSRRSGAGYPDWTFAGRGGVAFRECKAQRGRLRDDQAIWLEQLQKAGADVAIWRPADLASGRIGHELTRLAGLDSRGLKRDPDLG